MTDPASRQPPHEDEIARALRAATPAPDLTDSILDRVALHRTFLDRRARRLLWATRCAIGAGVLMLAGAIVFIHEHYPHVRGEAPRATPLSSVVASAQGEARRLQALRDFDIPEAPLPALGRIRLTLGDAASVGAEQPLRAAPVTGAGPGRTVVLVMDPAFEDTAAAVRLASEEVAPVDGRPAALLQASRERLSVPQRLEFPSAAEAVHRWAITADVPSAPRLLGSGAGGDAPLLIQGPISDEVRLPR